MYAVKLVLVFIKILQPKPLYDACFVKTCGSIGIKLQHFYFAVFIAKVKAAINRRMFFVPCFFYVGDKIFWDLELAV